jgi:hypothetical protein
MSVGEGHGDIADWSPVEIALAANRTTRAAMGCDSESAAIAVNAEASVVSNKSIRALCMRDAKGPNEKGASACLQFEAVIACKATVRSR